MPHRFSPDSGSKALRWCYRAVSHIVWLNSSKSNAKHGCTEPRTADYSRFARCSWFSTFHGAIDSDLIAAGQFNDQRGTGTAERNVAGAYIGPELQGIDLARRGVGGRGQYVVADAAVNGSLAPM